MNYILRVKNRYGLKICGSMGGYCLYKNGQIIGTASTTDELMRLCRLFENVMQALY